MPQANTLPVVLRIPFYSESNIRYLERKKREIDEGRAHIAEHELIEGDD